MNYSNEELVIINNLIDLFIEDTDKAIEFLVIGFGLNENDLEELGCLEITQIIKDEVLSVDFDIIKSIMQDFELDGFDINTFAGTGQIKKPCKNPCVSCPYTKNSKSGYFGGHDPIEYSLAIHQDTVIACHTRTKHDSESGLPLSNNDVTICTGHIVSQIKVCKSTKHPDGKLSQDFVRDLDNFEKLKDNALGFDFNKHHNIG